MIKEAILCASMLLPHYAVPEGVPKVRYESQEKIKQFFDILKIESNSPTGYYLPNADLIVMKEGATFDEVIHEVVHWLQDFNGLNYSTMSPVVIEAEAYYAQSQVRFENKCNDLKEKHDTHLKLF